MMRYDSLKNITLQAPLVTNANDFVVPHELYTRLGKTIKKRCEAYRALFDVDVSEMTIH